MAENPLLPDADLRKLHGLTKRAALLDKALTRPGAAGKARKAGATFKPAPNREALLAGTLIHLAESDLLVTDPGDTTSRQLLEATNGDQPAFTIPQVPPKISALPAAVAMAAALSSGPTGGIVLASLRPGSSALNWRDALAWAQEQQLPLVLACADASGAATFRDAGTPDKDRFEWASVRRVTSDLQLPVLSVDGEDAVAVYRVMQESALRARSKSGPAVIWAMLPSQRELDRGRPASELPIRRLERYLRARRIQL